ncbi:heat-shock protein [bacterium DOLZORAL124_38_8]|nr:MAG: heat-shock protein [bacterium DOLZORAL124_38_8]
MQEKSISESKEATKNNIEIFKIAPQTQKCTGVVEMDCLVVNGELFYDSIDGFEFENGYNYELEVEKKQLCDSKNPSECPQDKGMYQYTLKKVLKKEKN